MAEEIHNRRSDQEPQTAPSEDFGLRLTAALERTASHRIVSEHEVNLNRIRDSLNDLEEFRENKRSDDALQISKQKISRLLEYGRTWPSQRAWRTYFMQEIAKDRYLEAQLMLMSAATGCVDSVTFTTYSVFTTKMTGNMLFLALYALHHPDVGFGIEKNVGISIGVFVLGAIFFGHIGHFVQQRRRLWVLMTNLFQTLLVLAAAAIRFWVSRDRTGTGAQAILALLALSFSGQIAMALCVQMPELNTTMITGALIQLCTDSKFFQLHNIGRNRRLLFISSLVTGCFIGASALVFKSPTCALLLVGCIKALGTFSFLFNYGIMDTPNQLEDAQPKTEGTATPISRILWAD